MSELTLIPATIHGGLEPSIDDNGELLSLHSRFPDKLRALIELESLSQTMHPARSRRSVSHTAHSSCSTIWTSVACAGRWSETCTRQHTERKQCVGRERREKQKHAAQLDAHAAHGRQMLRVNPDMSGGRACKLGWRSAELPCYGREGGA